MKFIKSCVMRISKDFQHKELLPLKLLFFVHASTLFVLYPYLTIHMRELGINVEETAIMSAVTPVVAIIMPPLAGMIADKIGNFKMLLSISSVMGGGAALLLLLVPVGRVQVTYPARTELLLGCNVPDLNVAATQFSCNPLHPFSFDVEIRQETCGFACEWRNGNASLAMSEAISYAVKLRSISEGATEAFRYPLTPGDLPQLFSLTDHTSLRNLKNNERYRTAVRWISDNLLFFPTHGMYNFDCKMTYDNSTEYVCDFGSNSTENLETDSLIKTPASRMVKIMPLKEKSDLRVLPISSNKEMEKKYIQQFRLESLSERLNNGENMTSKQLEHIKLSQTTCTDHFSKEDEEISVELLLRPVVHMEGPPVAGGTVLLEGCSARCLASTPRDRICSSVKENIDLDISLTFWSYLVVRVFIGIIGGTAFAMFEGAVIAILREHEADYGLQRIYGSIGGMISSPLSGMLIDYASAGKGYTDFRPAFYLYAILKVFSAFLMMNINLEFKSPATNLMNDVVTVLKNVEIVALFVACFVLGTLWGYIESFLFWLLQDLGGSRSLMGITITVGGIAGIPLLALSGPIIEKFGHANVLFVGFLFYAIRLMGYSLIYNPWMCLIFEALEGVTSSLAITAAVTYAARLSSATTDSSVQGLLGGLYYGVGKGAGSLIGGYLMKAFGTRPTYQIFAVSSVITGTTYYLFNKFFITRRPQIEGNDICKKKIKDIEAPEKGDTVTRKGTDEKMPLKDSKNNINLYLDNVPTKKSINNNKTGDNNLAIEKLTVEKKDGAGHDNPTFEDTEVPSNVRDRKLTNKDVGSDE